LPRRHVLVIRALFVGWALGITYLALSGVRYPVVSDINDKLQHLGAFFALGLLLDFSFPGRPFGVAKIGVLMAYGLLLELVQSATPVRDPSFWDVGADALGLLLYATSTPVLRRLPILERRWSSAAGALKRG
jgi:VanZ family protein